MAKVQIEQDDGAYVVIAPYNEDFKEWAKYDAGARWDPDLKGWRFDEDSWSLKDLEGEVRLHYGRNCF